MEIKRTKPTEANIRQANEQVSYYMATSGIKRAVVYFYYSRNKGQIEEQEYRLPAIEGLILVIATKPTD